MNLAPGTKYLVLDIGGGTVDITCHEVLENKSIGELVPPSGGDWGSTYVNENFMKFLEEIFGPAVDFAELKSTPEWLTLVDSFEVQRSLTLFDWFRVSS